MSPKLYLLLLSFLFTVSSVSAGVADQNERLKLLIERAKARKASELAQPSAPVPATVEPVAVPVAPAPAPVIVVPVNPSPSVVPSVASPTQPTAPVRVRPVIAPSQPVAPTPERKPKVLETHPKAPVEPVKEIAPVVEERVIIKETREKPVREKPVRVKETVVTPSTTTIIEKKTTLVQPAVQTLVTPVTSPIQTKGIGQTTIIQTPAIINPNSKNGYGNLLNSIESVQSKPGTPIQSPALENAKSLIQEKVTNEAAVENQTEFKAQPNTGSSSYNDVLNSIDEILKGQRAEEEASQKSKSKAPELNPKPLSKKEERKAEPFSKESFKNTKPEAKADKDSPLINEGFAAKDKDVLGKTANGQTATASAADKDADYLLVMRKSLKSLEEDSWANVKLNMGEALDYFAKEKKLYPNNPKLNTYYKVILGFQRFSEGGLELDEGDFADFEDAEALYLDTQDLLEESKKELGKDYDSEQVRGIVDTVLKYTEEELQYIEEMLGM